MPAEEVTRGAMTATVVVITGAAPLDRRAVAAVPRDAVLIAADGGLDHARAAGLDPAVLVGDLDSISALGLAWASEHTEVVRHPIDKAATDTELAIAHAATLRARRGSCSSPARATASTTPSPPSARSALRRWPPSASLEAWWGNDQLHVVHGPGSTDARPAAGHDVLGARHARPVRRRHASTGARWPLARPRARRRSSASASATRSPRHRSTVSVRAAASSPSSSPERRREPPRRSRRRSSPSPPVPPCCRRAATTTRRPSRSSPTTRSPTSGTSLNDALDDVHRRDRHRRRAARRRRHRDDGLQGRADRRQPRGRRDVRRRQHVPVAGRRRRRVRAVRGRRARQRARTSCAPSCPTARPRPSTSATCASTTTSPGSTSTTSSRRPTSPPWPTRPTPTCSSSQNPATSSPGLAFVLATIAEFGEDGWQRLLGAAARQRRRGRRRLDRGLLRAVLRGRRRPQAARRQLRHEPAGRGRVRRPADRRRDHGGRSTRRASARSSSPACCAAPSTPTRPASSSTSCCRRALPGRAAAEPVRLPGQRRRRRCPTCSPTTPRSPPIRLTLDPATIAANREAWIAEWTDTVLR